MSSLTTAGSSMEEGFEFHPRLSLEIRETSRAQTRKTTTTVRLFGELISPQEQDRGGGRDDHQQQPRAAAGRKLKRADQSGVAVIAPGTGSGGGHSVIKKPRTTLPAPLQDDDGDHRRTPSDGGSSSRKKLRLTAAQAAMLEDSFRAHSILSHAQKQELARRVGLSARQVEVWFQNRRARTKLKQTEVDCELLRRWCDHLTDENARLRRDLADLRAAAAGKLPAVSVVCTSCCYKRTAAIVAAGDVA